VELEIRTLVHRYIRTAATTTGNSYFPAGPAMWDPCPAPAQAASWRTPKDERPFGVRVALKVPAAARRMLPVPGS
jgi:hypothetical protein